MRCHIICPFVGNLGQYQHRFRGHLWLAGTYCVQQRFDSQRLVIVIKLEKRPHPQNGLRSSGTEDVAHYQGKIRAQLREFLWNERVSAKLCRPNEINGAESVSPPHNPRRRSRPAVDKCAMDVLSAEEDVCWHAGQAVLGSVKRRHQSDAAHFGPGPVPPAPKVVLLSLLLDQLLVGNPQLSVSQVMLQNVVRLGRADQLAGSTNIGVPEQ